VRQRANYPDQRDPELTGLLPWRRTWLERAGFDPDLADALAKDRRVDLHAVLVSVDHGCAPELAARIFSPLDGPEVVPR
jgi:hypothetical protein